MNLTSSQEDYLEAIYNEILNKGSAKVTDIASLLNVKKASVTGALNSLLKKELINYSPYSSITLTQSGEKVAKEVIKKHKVMADFFRNILHLNNQEAIEHACKMEHIMSDKMFKRMSKFSSYIQEICDKNPEIKAGIEKLYK